MIALFAEAPALPLHTAGPYVAAAYIVFVLILLVYVGIMATRLSATSVSWPSCGAGSRNVSARPPSASWTTRPPPLLF